MRREDFPLLAQLIRGKSLSYLDNAATTQKPFCVLEAMQRYYLESNANVNRGVHWLSEQATQKYEDTRLRVRNFLNAKHTHEVIFTRGTTEAINLVANSFGFLRIGEGDEIVLSEMEHHSNIVPWQLFAKRVGASIKVIPVCEDGTLDKEAYSKLLNTRTKLVAITHASNVLGTINPVAEFIDLAHQHDIPVLIDGAQAVAHISVDVQALDCDFYAFSSHKFYGPTGVGVLYGKTKWLEAMPPYQGGGNMIRSVSFSETQCNGLPDKFEAGTPSIAEVIGMGAAIQYFESLDQSDVKQHELALLKEATFRLKQIPGLTILADNLFEKVPLFSFVMHDIHPHDIATVLDYEGIAIRAGHHCAMPLMQRYKVPATARVSFSFYNTDVEIERLIQALKEVHSLFRKRHARA